MSSSSTQRVIGRVSRVSLDGIFYWYVVDIPPIVEFVRSPEFRFGQCLWHLTVGPTGKGDFIIFLFREWGMKFEVTPALGWRKADGSVVEGEGVALQRALSKGECGPEFFIILSIKEWNEFQATKTFTCRFIGKEETEPLPKQIEDSQPGISTRHGNTSGHREMCHSSTTEISGTVLRGSDSVFNWYLVDIPPIKECFRSPAFRFGKCLWHLEVSLMGSQYGDLYTAYLKRVGSADDLGPEEFKVTHALGWMKADGAVVENTSFQWAFRKGGLGPLFFIPPSIKDYDEFRATKTFTCRFIGGEETEPQPKQIEVLETLSSDFGHLLNSEENSDVVLNVQGREYRAHRAVLAARSPVFRTTFSYECEGKRTGVVDIPDCDPESFSHLLLFLYSGKVEELTFDTTVGLYKSADKYGVQALKSACSDRLRRNLTPENVSEVAALADLHSDEGLASAAQTFFNEKYVDVLQTSGWTTLLKNHPRVADKLSKEMAAAVKNRSRTADENVSSADPEVKKKRLNNSD